MYAIKMHCSMEGGAGMFACFPAGTPIAAKGGYKNIEDIQVGDLVWSWDQFTGDIGLKPVTAIMENTADTLIKITSGSEKIYATPEHPFWVGESINGNWKNAEDLTLEDELWLLDKRNKSIFSLELEPQDQPVKVYNFEVAEWHTYFVGMWMMLVHNICYKKVFFEAFPWLKGKVVLHHAIEQQVLKRYKGLFTKEEIHALENLRGIPKELNNTLHLSDIRKEWNSFYKEAELAKVIPTREQVQKFANFVDSKYGNLFNPPLF